MNFRKIIFAGLLLLSSSLMMAQNATTYVEHVVEKGQTLYSIGQMYGVSVDVLTNLNPSAKDVMHIGDKLRIPSNTTSKGTYHTVKGGETLYRLGIQYGLSASDIVKANPGLTVENFKAGQVIFIPESTKKATPDAETVSPSPSPQITAQPQNQVPQAGNGQSQYRDMHKVKKGETLFSIAQQYGVSQDEILAANPEVSSPTKIKKNSFLRIPYPKQTTQVQTTQQKEQSDLEAFQEARPQMERSSVLKAALVLPFLQNGQKTAETERMVEYYEGFLMAVDSLKKEGVSMEIYTYNSGSTVSDIRTILGKDELKQMNVIFGPLHNEQIKPMADFAKENGIRLVVPFTSKEDNVFQNPMIYQINTPQSYLYSEVYDHFAHLFPKANVIFFDAQSSATDKGDFITGFRQDLERRGLQYRTLSANADAQTLKGALKDGVANVVVPNTGSQVGLLATLPVLAAVRSDSLMTNEIHLFGYPEYQTYTDDHLTNFFEQDTYFYSSFYTNNLLTAARSFITSYRRWYGKDMADRYPKYGMLGFDTGYYFLKGISRYGTKFEEHLKDVNVTPIQTAFKFERVNNWGGFINKKAFFVHFSKDFNVTKMDFD